MKKTFLLCLVLFAFPLTTYAVKPRPAKPYVPPTKVPATIGKVTYVTGYPPLDTDKYARRIRYRGRFELGEHAVVFRRTRIKQDGRKGVESVDILGFRYSDIEKLYIGKDAMEQIKKGSLPTATKKVFDTDWGFFVPLEKYVTRKLQSPVIIFYKHEGKTLSLVVMASHIRAQTLYKLLSKQAEK